jgi:hypothetical protein
MEEVGRSRVQGHGCEAVTRVRRKTVKPASDRLLRKLPLIALELRYADWFGKDGRRLGSIDAELLCELGAILSAILNGEDARRLFRQNERTKPKSTTREAIALVYFYFRANSGNVADDSEAIERVKGAAHLNPPTTSATIRKYAQAYRDSSFAFLSRISRDSAEARWRAQLWIYSLTHSPDDTIADSFRDDAAVIAHVNSVVPPLTSAHVAALREYLRKKTSR